MKKVKKMLWDVSPRFWIGLGISWIVVAIVRVFEKDPAASILYSLGAGVLLCAVGMIRWLAEKRHKKN